MLTIKPEGGICNRLFAMHAAIRLSADIDQPLRLVWYADRALGCWIEQLFEVPPEFCEVHQFCRIDQNFAQKSRDMVRKYFRMRPMRPTYNADQISEMRANRFDFTSFARRKHTQINACILFYASEEPFYRFQPVPSLQQRIDEVTENFDHTIGIHIRRTDHKPSREFSPTHLFEERMQEEIDRNKDTTFFLATDDPQEEAHLMKAFPQRVTLSPKRSLDRKHVDALEDAVVDLYALAATRKIFGSFASTFSRGAGLLGGIEAELLQSVPDAVATW